MRCFYPWQQNKHRLLNVTGSFLSSSNSVTRSYQSKTLKAKKKTWDKAEIPWVYRVNTACSSTMAVNFEGLCFLVFKGAKMTAAQQRASTLVVALWSSGMTGAFYVTLKRKVGGGKKKKTETKFYVEKKIYTDTQTTSVQTQTSSAVKRNVIVQKCLKYISSLH